MERTERLLDLIALFLDAREPVSWTDIREAFPDEYGKGTSEAAERKFERDKSELAELGVALEWRPATEEAGEGYVLSREAYYLPRIDFSPEELAVLYAAGSAALASGAFPGRADLSHALRKIAFHSDEDPQAAPKKVFAELEKTDGHVAERLEQLWQALLSRKRVRIRYRAAGTGEVTDRLVDPHGICLRRGAWVMVGHCHLRKAERTFHVERILDVEVNASKPKSPDYEIPADFQIARIAGEQVWEHVFHEPMEVEVALSPQLVPMAGRLLPGARVEGSKVVVRATYLDGLIRRLLQLGDGARVVAPPEAVARARRMIEAVAAAHRAGEGRAA